MGVAGLSHALRLHPEVPLGLLVPELRVRKEDFARAIGLVDRVPTDVVDVHVRVQDDIDVAGREASVGQRLIEVADREVRAAAVAQAGIDEDVLPARTDQVAGDGHRHEAALVGEVAEFGDELVGVVRHEHVRVHEQGAYRAAA